MKKLIYIIIIFSFNNSANCGNKWVKVSNYISRFYYSVSSLDSLNCAAVSSYFMANSRLDLTTDGGNTWEQMFKDEDIYLEPEIRGGAINLNSVAYPSPDLIICGGDRTWILRSTDNGQNWNRFQIDSNGQDIERMRMFDNKFGAAITRNTISQPQNYMYLTNDGGVTWTKFNDKRVTPNSIIWDISVSPDGVLYAYIKVFSLYGHVDSCHIFKTSDFGQNWEMMRSFSTGSAKIFFTDSLTGWAMFWYPVNFPYIKDYIYKTTDGARTWNLALDSVIPPARDMVDFYFYNNNIGIYYGTYGKILVSIDGGATWQQEYLPDSSTYYDISAGIILSENNRFLFTKQGAVFRYVPANEVDDDVINHNYSSCAFYNPFCNTIFFPYNFVLNDETEMRLCDINGKVQLAFNSTDLIDHFGYYSLPLNELVLSRGVYLVIMYSAVISRAIKLMVY